MISYRQYKSEYYEDQLIEANPELRLIVRFDAGQEIQVPEVEPMPIRGLAPWRRVVRR